MKKLFYILVSAIVALGAVACNNEFDENIEANTTCEGVSFTVALDEEASRVIIGDREEGTHTIYFSSEDVIYAESSELGKYTFETTDGKTFVCEEPSSKGKLPFEMIGKELEFYNFKLPYSDLGSKGVTMTTTTTLNKSNETVTLTVGSPVLALVAPVEGITLHASESIFSYSPEAGENANKVLNTFEVKKSETDENGNLAVQYVPIQFSRELDFWYTIGDDANAVKQFTKKFDTKIYNLGTLSAAVASVNGVNYTELGKAIAAAIENNVAVEVADNAELAEQVTIPADKALTINLNGKTVSGNVAKSVGHVLRNEGTLTINGGTIVSAAENGGSAIYNAEGATVILDEVELQGAPQAGEGWPSYALNNYGEATLTGVKVVSNHGALASFGKLTVTDCEVVMNGFGGSSHVFYLGEGADVVVNGGTYTHNGNTDGSLAYVMTGAKLTVNDGYFTASNGGYGMAAVKGDIIINGGKFDNAPLDWGGTFTVTGGAFKADPSKLITEEYKAVKDAEEYFVVSKKVPAAGFDGLIFEDIADAFKAAVAKGETVTVTIEGKDENGNSINYTSFPASELNENITVDAQGATFVGKQGLNVGGATVKNANFSNESGTAVTGTINGTFEDCSFEGANGLRWCYAPAKNTTTVFKNCTFSGDTYGAHFDGGEGIVEFNNCTFSGFNAFGDDLELLTFNECLFIPNETSIYNGVNLWGTTVMKNTKFDWTADTAYEWCDPCSAASTYTFENVTINRTGEWVPIQFADMWMNAGTKVTIDGVLYEAINDGITIVNGEYEISKASGLTWMAEQVNTGANNFRDKTVKLVADIDLEGAAWTPVGVAGKIDTEFCGTFDGQDHTISNFKVESAEYAGFFGSKHMGDILNVKFDNATISGNHYAAVVLAWGDGANYSRFNVKGCEVTNSTVTLAAASNDNGDKGGAIVGYAYAIDVVENKANTVEIKGYRDLGGVVGCAQYNSGNDSEYAIVKNNSLENVTITVDNSVNYQEYAIQQQYNVAPYAGRIIGTSVVEDNTGSVTINWGEIPEYIARIEETGANYVSIAAAVAAAENGQTIRLREGEYKLPNLDGRDLTFVGDSKENVKIDMKDLTPKTDKVTFKSLTMLRSNKDYCGMQHCAEENYVDCIIDGTLWVYAAKADFTNCTFTEDNANAYNVWVYGQTVTTFTECDFTCAGKSVLIYSEGNGGDVELTDCEFTATAPVEGKAAIEIDSSVCGPKGKWYNVTITNCEANGFATGSVSGSTLYNPKKGNYHTIIVDGMQLVANGVVLDLNNKIYEISNKAGMFWFNNEVNVNNNSFEGYTVMMTQDIDLENEEWTPVGQQGATTFAGKFNGNDKTLKNLSITTKVNTAGYASGLFGWIVGSGDSIENLNIDGATIEGYHYVATIVGHLSAGADVKNCSVANATIVADPYTLDTDGERNGDKVGAIVGMAYDGSEVTGNKATNVEISAYRHTGGIIGYTYGTVRNNSIENVTITVENGTNSYAKKYKTVSEYGVNSIVGVAGEGSVVENNSGKATLDFGDIKNDVVYLTPGCWDVDGAWFGIWSWGNKDAMTAMTKEGDYYKVIVPEGNTNILFIRLNPAGTLDWSSVWNQTVDLVVPATFGNNVYTITGWNANEGAWGAY